MKLSMLVAGAVGLGLNVALSPAAQAEVTEVVVTVPECQSMTYAEALKAAGYDSYPGNLPMTKSGKGTLTTDKSLVGHYVRPLTVAEGVLLTTDDASYDDALGARSPLQSQLKVLPGGTIRCEGNGIPLNSRPMYVAGEGAEGQGGALVAADGYCVVNSMNYMLDGDTTFFSENSPEGTYLLRGTILELRGHTLTLKSTDRGHVIPGGVTFRAAGSGTIKVDKSNLIFSTLSTLTKDAGTALKLVLVNGAGYYAVLPECYPLFDVIDAEAGCTLGCRYSPTDETVEAALKVLKGAPTVRDDITALSISDSFTVRVSELKDGHALTMKGALMFGAKAKLVIEGDMDEMLATGETVAIAAAEGGVTGFPAFEMTPGTKNWRLAAGEDGKSIVFNYVSPKPEGSVDARAEWKILPGADQAADNAVKFSAAMAACADNATIFFPAGDYYFAAPLEIGAKTGVTILGEDDASVLHLASETATCVLSAVGANGLTLKEIAFADCAGVAVAASGTTGLTVKGCWYKAIGGAIANVSGTYPISISGGTDSFVRGNRTADSAAYTAHVWLDGGNVLPKSEPDAGLVLCVSRGEIDDFATAFARSGYSTFADGLNLVKVGEGTLIGTQTQLVDERNIITSIKSIDIDEGTLSLANPDDCCPNNGGEDIRIKDGATLQIDNRGGGLRLVSRTITFVGTGASGKKGAIVIGPGAESTYSALSLVLGGDATIYNENESGVAAFFRNIIINTVGHRLTLKAATPESGFEFALRTMNRTGSGEVLADGVTLSDGGEGSGADEKCVREAGSAILLKLANGSTFKPRANAIFTIWKGIEMDASSQILGRTAGIEATIGDWIGCGALDENIASLTITNSLKVKAADLKAGNHLTVAGALVTRPEVRVTLEDAALLNALEPGDAQPPFAFAASATSISAKPRRASGCDFAGWSVMDGEAGLSWVFDHSGMTVIVR